MKADIYCFFENYFNSCASKTSIPVKPESPHCKTIREFTQAVPCLYYRKFPFHLFTGSPFHTYNYSDIH